MIDPSEVAETLRDFQAIAMQKVEHVLQSPPAPDTDKQNKSKKGNESATAQEGEDLKEVHEETWAEL